jgi:hypothetical protein
MNTFELKTLQKKLEEEQRANYIYLRNDSLCLAESLDKKFNVDNASAEEILEMVVCQIAIKSSKDCIENIASRLKLGIEDVTQRMADHLLYSVEIILIELEN